MFCDKAYVRSSNYFGTKVISCFRFLILFMYLLHLVSRSQCLSLGKAPKSLNSSFSFVLLNSASSISFVRKSGRKWSGGLGETKGKEEYKGILESCQVVKSKCWSKTRYTLVLGREWIFRSSVSRRERNVTTAELAPAMG